MNTRDVNVLKLQRCISLDVLMSASCQQHTPAYTLSRRALVPQAPWPAHRAHRAQWAVFGG